MRKIIATEYVTLDGVMEDPGGGEKFRFGGWSFRFWNEEASKFKLDELLSCDTLLLGRVTYQGFAKAWPTMKDNAGFADRMNSIQKYVISKTLKNAAWNNSSIINGNILEETTKLKDQKGKNILIAGSGKLVVYLMNHNLVDEIRLMVHPVVLGTGKKLFGNGTDMKIFKLSEINTFQTGIVVLTFNSLKKEEN